MSRRCGMAGERFCKSCPGKTAHKMSCPATKGLRTVRVVEAYKSALAAGMSTLAEMTAEGVDPVVGAVVAQAVANHAYVDRMTVPECPGCGVPLSLGLLVEVEGGYAGDCPACGESVEVAGVVRLVPRGKTTVKRPTSRGGGRGWTR